MPGLMRERIDPWISARDPARKQIDRQREPVHLGEQRNDEGREGAEGTPVAARLGLGKTEGENDEDGGVDDHQPPEAISRHRIVRHRLFPSSSGLDRVAWPWPP